MIDQDTKILRVKGLLNGFIQTVYYFIQTHLQQYFKRICKRKQAKNSGINGLY